MGEESESNTKGKLGKISLIIGIVVGLAGMVVGVVGMVVGVVGAINSIINTIEDKKVNQHNIEREETERQPGFDIKKVDIVPLEDGTYAEYRIHNMKANMSGGDTTIHAVLVIECENIVVKVVAVQDAIYEDEIFAFDVDEQTLDFCLKEPDILNRKKMKFQNDLEDYLENNGKKDEYDFDVRIAVVMDWKISDKNNASINEKYVVYMDDLTCYVNDGEYDRCDKYYMTYDEVEAGEEYDKLIENTGDRIADCG